LIRAVIFASGEIADTEWVGSRLRPDDLIIAADGGVRYPLALSVPVAAAIGDFDSTPPELLQIVSRSAGEVIRYPERKDKTDLELALDYARGRGVEEVLIFGALGGRLDHALANVMLLAGTAAHPSVHILESGYALHVVHDRLEMEGAVGDTITLLALSGDAEGVTTTGLEYALEDGIIPSGSTLGVSNVMTAGRCRIAVRSGRLLVVHLSATAATDASESAQLPSGR